MDSSAPYGQIGELLKQNAWRLNSFIVAVGLIWKVFSGAKFVFFHIDTILILLHFIGYFVAAVYWRMLIIFVCVGLLYEVLVGVGGMIGSVLLLIYIPIAFFLGTKRFLAGKSPEKNILFQSPRGRIVALHLIRKKILHGVE